MQKRRRRKGTQFDERVTGVGKLGTNFLDLKLYPTCLSSKLCEFILFFDVVFNVFFYFFCCGFLAVHNSSIGDLVTQ